MIEEKEITNVIDIDNLKKTCSETIDTICEKYKNNEYILGRINTHINTILSTTIENELKTYEERIERHNTLTLEQTNFIQVFLSKNNYYYLHSNTTFYEYDGVHYKITKEDDILHSLLSAISKERVLLDWKHKTKINIMKQIKERNLLKSIPESDTIQNVLNILCPLIFSTKDEAKYFLTIYGCNILKKPSVNNLVFLVHPHTKKMLTDIDKFANYFIGVSNLSSNFMTKYHENHDYNVCRLLNSNINYNSSILLEHLKIFGLDLLCVAAHYSNRYESSDNYIDNKSYHNLRTYTYYLRDNKQDYIVNNFCNKYIEKCAPENGCLIQWKNLHYVWKQFLSSMNFPNIIYSNNLKNILKMKYEYNEETDVFLNVTTKFLPFVSDFIKFWETTITHENINNDNLTFEYELDEICGLFKFWKGSSGNMNEQEVIKILKHFFPTIEIIEDKYIIAVKCSLFDKTTDIKGSLEMLKKDNQEFLPKSIISFEDLYTYYNNYYKTIEVDSNVPRFIVSKRYFENYISKHLEKYVVYNNFITCEWFNEN